MAVIRPQMTDRIVARIPKLAGSGCGYQNSPRAAQSSHAIASQRDAPIGVKQMPSTRSTSSIEHDCCRERSVPSETDRVDAPKCPLVALLYVGEELAECIR